MSTSQHQYKSKQISDNRKKLIELSNIARDLRETVEDFADLTINEILIHQYTGGENWEFKTLREWRKQGKKVKKGSKSFLVWGKKRSVEQDDSEDEASKEYKFFPICYLFSHHQVEPIS